MSKMILIVEDDESIGHLEQMMAESHGHQVHWEQNPNNAQQRVKQIQPDIIIMDVMMPEKNGIDLARELRSKSESRDIPILFVSVINIPQMHPEALDLEKVTFLQKPFEMDDLLDQIEKMLHS